MEEQRDLTQQRATLISHLTKEIKKQTERARCHAVTSRFCVALSYEEFITLFSESANYILRKRGLRTSFKIDSDNARTIEQLWLHMSGNSDFEGDLRKGIMLQGSIGSGKSLLMESYLYLQNYLAPRTKSPSGEPFKGARFIHAADVATIIKGAEKGVQSLTKQTLIVDDLGREQKSVMEFGNVSNPMAELIVARADSALITHATTNYTLETLSSESFYGPMIGDRLRSMFNFITVQGKSRRE